MQVSSEHTFKNMDFDISLLPDIPPKVTLKFIPLSV